MTFPRRKFLHLTAGAAALPFVSRNSWGQAWPARPVHIVVGFPAGGGADITARIIGQWLSDRLRQQFIIENRPGAATNIATEAVVRSAPDGHTLLLVPATNAINATLYEKLNFDFIRDIAPVAGIMTTPLVMLVNPSFPAKTVAEFIAYAKANPSKITMASAGNGSSGHVAGELFKMTTGINILHVPYRGGVLAMADLLGGRVDVLFDPIAVATEHIKAGKLRALAVTSLTRLETFPDIPTVSDAVPGFEASAFFGLGAPRGTPAEIIGRLNKEVNAALADPNMKTRLSNLGGMTIPGSPSDFGKLIARETEKWARVIQAANIKHE